MTDDEVINIGLSIEMLDMKSETNEIQISSDVLSDDGIIGRYEKPIIVGNRCRKFS